MWEELCRIYSHLKPRLVILFGSYARGDYTDQSDIDVLVVSDLLPKDPREGFLMAFNLNYPKVIPTPMSTQVFLKKLEEGSTFILEAIEDGKIICGEEDLSKRLWKNLRKLGRGLREKESYGSGSKWVRPQSSRLLI